MSEFEPRLKPVLKPGSRHNRTVMTFKNKLETIMKNFKANLFVASSKIAKNARIILFVLTLALFVLAAGAPEISGSIAH